MSLLDKFEQVTMTADSRISAADMAFCKAHQAAYEASIPVLRNMHAQLKEAMEQQETLLRPTLNRSTDSFYSGDSYLDIGNLAEANLRERVWQNHRQFIESIVKYFATTYKVKLDTMDIVEAMLPEDPRRNSRSTDQEIANWCNKMDAITLNYEDVVNHIFTQLGGASFEDKALKELKEACLGAAYRYRDNQKAYEIKKGTISFEYGCHYDSWYHDVLDQERFELPDSMKAVMKAANMFVYQLGTADKLRYPFYNLTDYKFDGATFDAMDERDRFLGVKCFKNGRLDLKFASETLARQFAEEYLDFTA